jgi:hypothetical protein
MTFSKSSNNDDFKEGLGVRVDAHLDEQYSKIKEEQKAYFDQLSDKEKKYLIAHRLQMLKTTDEVINDSK